MEREQVRFRPGESPGKPIGGNVLNEPLSIALSQLASSRGYESQRSLARALGLKSSGTVKTWYKGEIIPSSESMGKVLVLLQPNDVELDSIIEPWREKIADGKGNKGDVAGSRRAIEKSLAYIKPSSTPLGKWFEKYAKGKGISLGRVLRDGSIIRRRDNLGLELMSELLQNVPDELGLSEQETEELAESVAKTIEGKIASGHVFNSSLGTRIKKMQKELQCATFTGQQAAELLDTSRQNISLIRLKMGLPLLLSEEHIVEIKSKLDKTKGRRTRFQNRFRNRKIEVAEE